MKKKRLNHQQLSRIRNKQQKATRRADASASSPAEGSLGAEQKGLVIAHFGQQLEIEALEGEYRGQVFRCHQRADLDALVTGDRVIWQPGAPYGVVTAQLSRETTLERPSPYGGLRPVAANIDTILLVLSPSPPPIGNLLDRYLVAAEAMGIRPHLLLNKCELQHQQESSELEDLLSVYTAIGYPVLRVSCHEGSGLPELRELLKERTSVFVGQSGVGKSALVNALLPGVDTLVGAVSEANEKGRHTTTTARLFHFPDGGMLIDSPGIREFGLWHLSATQVLEGFPECRPYLGHCRFRDCRHGEEPGCQLRAAMDAGEIDPRRMRSLQQILASLSEGK